uniref:Uncharacterized protein n=1 Tax=Glossina austeni TaxID=7395 RepID=A0A1A9VRN3_GLOAU
MTMGKILNGITITIENAQCYCKAIPVVLLQGQLIDLHAKRLSALCDLVKRFISVENESEYSWVPDDKTIETFKNFSAQSIKGFRHDLEHGSIPNVYEIFICKIFHNHMLTAYSFVTIITIDVRRPPIICIYLPKML